MITLVFTAVHSEESEWFVKLKDLNMNLMNISAHRDIRKWRNR